MLLSISNIQKSYIVDPILDGVSLIVEEHDKIGLIGNNGSGKTTLFNIITGEISKDDGDIFMPKDLKIGYLKQQLHTDSTDTIYENCEKIFQPIINMEKELRNLENQIANPECQNLESVLNKYGKLQEKFAEIEGYSYPSKIRGTLIGLGFSENDFEKRICDLSGGQKSRIALAKLLLEEPDLMLLDEPTNHLDIDAISWLEKYLKDFKGGLILISHDRYFLNNVVNKIALLEYHHLTVFKGNYSVYVKERKKQIEQMKKQYEDQQKEIKRQEAIIERYMGLGRDRFIKQGKSRQKLLDKMKKLPPPTEVKRANIRFSPKFESGKQVLIGKNLEKSFENHKIFENVNFNVFKNDKIGIIGPNGVGKSTLFKIITKQIEPNGGSIKYGSNVKIAYFDQELQNLSDTKTIIDEIWDEYPQLNHFDIRRYLAQFLFVGDDIFKLIGDLSGGEKGRVSLLKIMLKGANVLLLDEPTNHLDIDSKEILEEALNLYDGTVISISHDRYFLNSTCNKIFHMSKNGIDEYLGNYDYYLEKTTVQEEYIENTLSKTELDNIKREERKIRNEKKKARKIKEELENNIHKLEAEIENVDIELSKPEIYSDLDQVSELSNKRNKFTEKLESLYEDWFLIEENED